MRRLHVTRTAPPSAVVVTSAEPGRTRPRRAGRRRAGWASYCAPPLVTFGFVLGLRYLVSYAVFDPGRRFLLPPPQDVIGPAIATVLGMAIGIAMSQARWVERSLYPNAVVLQCASTLALVPVIGFWFATKSRASMPSPPHVVILNGGQQLDLRRRSPSGSGHSRRRTRRC